MSQKKIDILERALAREKSARKQAEKILEDKSAELYELTLQLSKANYNLESSVQEKKSQLKGIFENIIDAYVVIDLKGNTLKMNQAAIDMFGHDSNKEGFKLFNLVHQEDRKKTVLGFRELIKIGFLTNFQIQILIEGKHPKIVQVNSSIVFDKNNNPIAAQGIARDVTKEKESKDRLKASENRLATVILNLNSGILLSDANNNVIITNSKFCEVFHLDQDPSELVGCDSLDIISSNKNLFEDPNQFFDIKNEVVRNRQALLAGELKMIDGRIFERDFIPIYEDREYTGHLWRYRDVTLQRNYNLDIEAQRQKYSNIIANMNLGLLEVDKEDRILFVNQCFQDMSGYKAKELLGFVASDIFLATNSKKKLIQENEDRLGGFSNSYELLIQKKDHEHRNWLVSGAPQYNINGEVTGSIGIHLDISDFRKLEKKQEVLLDKLEKSNTELEEYAQIVSHDLKSPLRSLYALTTWLKEDNVGKFDEVSLDNFELIEKTLEKMDKLISDILDYSSITFDSEKMSDVDLNEVVEGLHHVLLIPKHINLIIKNKLPVLKGDPTRFQQLFLNIVSNAVRFIDKDKGLIEISVNEYPSYYEFSIKDNGTGIEKKDFKKIFKIFRSLTANKDSSGIGLSIVKKIINLFQGEVWLESEVGIGTTFYFTISKQK